MDLKQLERHLNQMVIPQVYKNLGLQNAKMVNLEKEITAKINQNEYKTN